MVSFCVARSVLHTLCRTISLAYSVLYNGFLHILFTRLQSLNCVSEVLCAELAYQLSEELEWQINDH